MGGITMIDVMKMFKARLWMKRNVPFYIPDMHM